MKGFGTDKIIKENEHYIRLLTCLNYAGRRALLEIMFNNGLSRSKKDLYNQLLVFQKDFVKLKSSKIISTKQFALLYPNSKTTDFDEFDISLLYQIIRNCTTLPAPMGGWKIKESKQQDQSIAAFIIRLRLFRNKISHYGNTNISDADFKLLWKELMDLLTGLNYRISNVKELEHCPLDATYEYKNAIVKSQIDLCSDQIDSAKASMESMQTKYEELSKMSDLTRNTNCVEFKDIKYELRKLKSDLESCIGDNVFKVYSVYDRLPKIKKRLSNQTKVLDEDRDNLDGPGNLTVMVENAPFSAVTQDQNDTLPLIETNLSAFRKELTLHEGVTAEKLSYLTTCISGASSFTLDTLTLRNCGLTDAHILALKEMVPYLDTLCLSRNKFITNVAWKALSNEICMNKFCRLNCLTLDDCNISDAEFAAIAEMIPLIRRVDMSRNKNISPIGLKYLANTICQTPNLLLEELILWDCNLQDSHLVSLAACISRLNNLNIGRNRGFTPTGLESLTNKMLEDELCCLRRINLSYCDLNDGHLSALYTFFSVSDDVSIYGRQYFSDITWKFLSNVIYDKGTLVDFLSLPEVTVNKDNVAFFTKLIARTRSIFMHDAKVRQDALSEISETIFRSDNIDTQYLGLSTDHDQEPYWKLVCSDVRINTFDSVILKPTWMSIIANLITGSLKQQLSILNLRRYRIEDSQLYDLGKIIHCVHDIIFNGCAITANGLLQLITKFERTEKAWVFKHLDFSSCNLTDKHLQSLRRLAPYTAYLSLRENPQMSPLSLGLLTDHIITQNFCCLDTIDFSNCGLTDEHIKAMKNLIPGVKRIFLHENKMITAIGWRHFSDAIKSAYKQRLQYIAASRCNLSAKSLPVFLEGAQMSKEIDLSGNKMLEPHSELPFLQFTFVNSINLSDCNLKENGLAMISKMIPSLKRIDVSRNRTITVNGLKMFCDIILQNVMFQLDRISFEDCNLTNDHLHAVHGAFLLIKEVSIRNNKRLTISAFSELSNAIISANTLKLENLDISNCNISTDHIVKMKEMIPLLKEISFNNNKTITAACLRYLADIISSASVSNLEKVSLCDCNISDQHLQGFSKALLRLRTVNLERNNKVSNSGLQSVASAASNNTCICTSLGLQECDLRNSDLDVFHQNRNVSVASIDKRRNNLLTEGIFINLNIEDLYQNDNLDMTWLKFNDRAISKLLSKYPLAAKLDLSGQNKITSIGYTAITAAILESNSNRMQSLVLQHCQLIDSDIQAMCTLLPYLKELDVSYNKTITPAGIKSMSLAIGDSVSCSLEVVKFRGCNITNCHVDMMDKVIEQVKVLDLSGNKFICENGWKRLSHFVTSKEHLKLEKLVVQDCNLNLSCLKSLQDVVSILVELDIKGNYSLKAADYSYLSKIISEPDNCNLTTVACDDLLECEVQVMGKALALFHTLKLQSSTILSSETLHHLFTAITQSHHCHLEVLDLSKITLTDLQLEEMLNILHLFQEIDLSDNNQATTPSNLQMLSTKVEVLSRELGLKLNTVKLRRCDITDEKIRSMQPLIPNIEKMDVSFNKTIQPVGLTYIGTALMESYSTSRLKCLSLAGCNLNKSHLKCLTNILPLLKEVIFDENKLLEVTDVAYISNVITNCERMQLESISFKNCGIRDGHVKVMDKLLIRMKTVDLSSNPSISEIGCTFLSNHITLNDDCALECLKFQNCKVTLTKLMALLPALVKLKDIELSNNPYLQPEEIKKVLNTVNLSDFSDLGCNLVKYFSLTDEHIKETATHMPSIKNLVLSSRGFCSVKGIADLASSILKSQTIKIKTLNMSGNYLTDEHVEALCKVFPLMEVIDLSGNKRLTRKAIKSLGNAINSVENVKIKELILKDINCSAGHIEEIITLIGKLRSFTLNLNNNKTVTPSSLRKLSQHICSTSDQSLTSLSLANCNLQECHLQSMSELISNIKTLDISQNKLITPKGLTHLLSNLSVTKMVKLTDLSLNNCNIKEKHLGALSKTIGFLKTLNLSNNNTISPAGITSLSSYLHTMDSVSLETVGLENCNLHHAHFDAMGVLLRHIKNLNVSGNQNMSEKDIIHMTMVVNAKQSNLENINLSNCNLKICHLVAISPMLPRLKKIDMANNWSIALNGIESLLKDASTSKTCNLETISISDCSVNVKAIEVIFSLAPSIKEIDFSKNRRITPTDLSSIAQNLRRTNGSRLETLNLSDCGIGDEHLKTLSEMMPQMKKIILNNNRRITYTGLKHVSDVLEKCLQQHGHVKLREVQLQNCNPSSHWEKLSKWNAFFKIVV